MDSALLDILVDPVSKSDLALERPVFGPDGSLREGTLRGADGRLYRVVGGIPRFVVTDDAGQRQTEASFGYKWRRRETYDSEQMAATARAWLVERYGFASAAEMATYMASKRRILDAGCGSGFSTSLWMDASWRGGGAARWIGVDISAAIDVAAERLAGVPGTNFVQADVTALPFRRDSFDLVFSEGVLHHTPSTERALASVASVLAPGGEIMFYVYRTKAPVREFADDHVRDALSRLGPDEAWEALRPLTALGRALSELHAEVDVPEDIPYLGIAAGRYDVQRLVYWHFAKLFWNESLSFDENNHVNFDWYHPRYSHRQTEDDLRRWCRDNDLEITRFDAQESGFTVRAVKSPAPGARS
jgi:SAM-dependent methyltransferase